VENFHYTTDSLTHYTEFMFHSFCNKHIVFFGTETVSELLTLEFVDFCDAAHYHIN